MAYEIGDKAEDYIGDVIEKYRNNDQIFSKVYALVPVYTSRPDWPHCFDELDSASRLILGQSFMSVIFGFTSRYLDDPEMFWPDNLPNGFIEELTVFHNTLQHLVYQYGFDRTSPFTLSSIAKSKDTYRDKYVIKLIRNDGQGLEFEMTHSELIGMVTSLEELMKGD